MVNERIESIISNGIQIIDDEIKDLAKKQKKEGLIAFESEKLNAYIRTLMIFERESRVSTREETINAKSLTDEELDQLLISEVEKAKSKKK